MPEILTRPWPWYVAGPLLGLFVPLFLFLGNRWFGVSASLRHTCAALLPARVPHFGYDWRQQGGWSLAFVAGIVIGGAIAGLLFPNPEPVAIAAATRADLEALGIREFSGLVPGDLFSWASLLTPRGMAILVAGGFLVGFGAAYAGGCTSGHGLTGVAALQPASVLALFAFFAGGIVGTFVLLPLIL